MNLDALLSRIRPAVRAERPYLVGAVPDVQVKLNQNESPLDLPDDLKRELVERFFATPFNRYPHEQPQELMAALEERLGVEAGSVLVGNGSNELTYTLGQVLIDPGTPVVMPRPMFSLYEKIARLNGAALTPVPPTADLRFDADALAAAVRRTRAALTVITTPNNPTGRAMTISEVEQVVAAGAEVEGFVVVDEAYVEFNPEPPALDLLPRYPNLIVLRTFSKAAGLAGLRLGYLVGRPEVMTEFMKARLPFMVDRLAEQTALALLERPDLLRERIVMLQASRETLEVALRAMPGVEVVPSAANFLIFRTPIAAKALHQALAARGVLVRDMSGYPELHGFLRVNAGTEDENRAFLVALEDALQAHTPLPFESRDVRAS